jgi:serine/threonine-protein kinase
MSLGPGARLGSYEILDSIGAGGMGEVYRARDTRLQRDVAIKVLPELFAADPDRLARFEREAQTLAALNHPNIAQIFGVVDLPAEAGSDTAGARAALVMELVDGEDLAQRLSRGPIALDDAVPVARQIADALEAAHELGIVHRDLKPANIKVRPDGTVKVLDFGLAKAMMPDVAGAGVPVANANSPTFASPAMTAHGVILGTAAYMAPEQARGRPVDRRADIWAFGCVLYEMLTGAGPFAGETVTDVLSAVISREPDWGSLPGATPSALVSLMRRCLEKDPRRRLRDIGEARLILEQPMDAGPTAAALKPARRSRLVPALAVLVVLLAVALVAIAARGFRLTDTTPRTLTRYDVRLPDKTAAMITFRPAVSVSADGSTFTALAAADGLNQVYVRTRADVEFRRIAGTERAVMAAVSPDGRSLAFFADGSLRKASIDGGATTLSAARDVRGLTWVDSVTIVVTPDSAGPLFMVSSSGGEMRPLTTLGAGERTHRWPDALPGGRAV